jgi:hypothetical protein
MDCGSSETLEKAEQTTARQALILNPDRVANFDHGVSPVVCLVRIAMASVGYSDPRAY